MGWASEEYLARQPIAVDVTTGAPTTPNDVQVAWGKGVDDLWSTIQSDGYDIRPYHSYGHGLLQAYLTFDLTAFDYSVGAKTLTVSIDQFPWATTLQTACLMIYYDDPDGDATDDSSAITVSGQIQGERAKVHPEKGGGIVVYARREVPGATLPSETISKTTDEDQMVWFNVEALLGKAEIAANGSLLSEEILGVSYFVLDAGVDQAAMRDVTKTQFYCEARGHGDRWVGVHIKGGSDGSDYTIQLQIETCVDSYSTVERTLDVRCLLEVQDPED